MRKKTWISRLGCALITGTLLAGMISTSAFAEGASVLDSTAADADPAGPGYTLTLGGLEAADTAKYYKIIEQDVDTVDGSGNTVVGTQQWKLTAAVDKNGDGIVDGTEETDFGHKTAGDDNMIGTADDVAVNGLYIDELVISSFEDDGDTVTSDTRQLTPAMMNALATAVTNNKAYETGSATADGDGVITVAGSDDVTSGMYMFVAVPGENNAKYIYKPIFLSYDYYNSVSRPEDNTHAITVIDADKDNPTDYPPSSGSTENAGVFKKSPLNIDKKSGIYDENGNPLDLQNDVGVGDTVYFSITVPVPTYSKNYVSPMFYITDDLTEGLKLDADSIQVTVKNGDDDVAVAEDKDYKIFTKTAGATTDGYHGFKNTLAESSTFEGFVVQFLNDDPTADGKQDGFLYTVLGAPTCTITYEAVVTETDKQKFAQQVNQMDNTSKLNFSKDPNYIPDGYFKTTTTTEEDPDTGETITVTVTEPDPDFDTNKPDTKDEDGYEEDTGELQDRTRHYTFDIDADVLGRDQSGDTTQGPDGSEVPAEEEDHDRTSEIRKIFVDANGQVIQSKETGKVVKGGEEQDGVSGQESGNYGWLEGAEFTLQKIEKHVTTYTGEDGQTGTEEFQALDTPEDMKFDAESHIRVATGGENPKSDGKGYIAMKGLDAGVYVLREIKAPLGYAFNPNVQFRITITPKYVMEPAVPPTPDDGKGGADDLILDSYTVEIVTQKLDDKLNVVGEETVTTISTYNMKKDDKGNPISLLKDDGSSNVDPASDPAGTGGVDVSVESFGNNTTAMIVNKKLGILPATGGSGLYFYLLLGGAVALFFLFLIRKVRKAGEAA